MLSLAAFALLLLLGLPIAVAILGAAMLQIALSGNAALLTDAPAQVFAGVESYGLLALPVFLLLGELMSASGAAERLMRVAALCVGPVRGGLGHVTLVANALLAAILGSSVAQITLMSRLAVPAMTRAGYPPEAAAATVAAGGLLAPVLPPSMLLIVFGVIAQMPVGQLFVAGLLPGALLLAALIAVTAWIARREGLAADPRRHGAALGTLLGALPAMAIPAVMIGAIVSGLATAVEAGIFGVLAVLVVGGAVYRALGPADLRDALLRAASGSAMVLFLIAVAALWGWIAAWENLPARAADALTALTADPLLFLLLLNLGLLLLGMVIDPMPALILVVPVFLPVAVESYGIDPLQFGLVVCVNLTLGLLTPPVGTGLFTAAKLNGIAPERLVLRLAPYLGAAALVLAALTLFPVLTTGLVRSLF